MIKLLRVMIWKKKKNPPPGGPTCPTSILNEHLWREIASDVDTPQTAPFQSFLRKKGKRKHQLRAHVRKFACSEPSFSSKTKTLALASPPLVASSLQIRSVPWDRIRNPTLSCGSARGFGSTTTRRCTTPARAPPISTPFSSSTRIISNRIQPPPRPVRPGLVWTGYSSCSRASSTSTRASGVSGLGCWSWKETLRTLSFASWSWRK